jgi:hypothetical protein
VKTIKEYKELTPIEVAQMLHDNGMKPVEGVLLSDEPLDKWDYMRPLENLGRVFVCAPTVQNMRPRPFPFGSAGGVHYKHCYVVTERWPNEVPDGVAKLPQAWLAYIGLGQIDEGKVPSVEEQCCLWGLNPDFPAPHRRGWFSERCGLERYHHAVDVRTPYARRCWPELVDAMEYDPPLVVEVGKWYLQKSGEVEYITSYDGASNRFCGRSDAMYSKDGASCVAEYYDLIREVRVTEMDGSEVVL